MPLYGHELDETIDPLTAGLSFAVKLNAGDFIGKTALVAIKAAGIHKKRIGLALSGKRIAREGAAILVGGREVGKVTSGTFSPMLEMPIAMGYVDSEAAKAGQSVGSRHPWQPRTRGDRRPAVLQPALSLAACPTSGVAAEDHDGDVVVLRPAVGVGAHVGQEGFADLGGGAAGFSARIRGPAFRRRGLPCGFIASLTPSV